MSEKLASLSRFLSKHWKRSLAVAFAGLVGLVLFSMTAAPAPTDNFDIPGSESQTALELFQKHEPTLAGVNSAVVFNVDKGKLSQPKNQTEVQKVIDSISKLKGVAIAQNPLTSKPPIVSKDGKIAMATVFYDLKPTEVNKQNGVDLGNALKTTGAVHTSMTGQVADAASEQSAPIGELIGVIVAIVLLSLLFRSKAAMVATIGGALVGVLAGQMILTILADPLGLPDFAKTIAMMLGLGAGIDYSLLIISRFREQVSAGDSIHDSIAKSAATSGASVVAAGLIVIIAVSGLLIIGIPLIGKMGVGAAIGIAAVVVSALTILPVMIGALSKWIKPKNTKDSEPSKHFENWGRKVTKRPWLSIVAGVAVLLVFAVPMLNMHLGQPDDGNQPKGETQRTAYDLISEGFGAGYNGPFLIAVPLPQDSPEKLEADFEKLYTSLAATEGVASVTPPIASKDKQLAVMNLTPTTSPQDDKTSALLKDLRNKVIPDSTASTNLKVYIGGATASLEDFSAKVSERLPLFIFAVIGFSVLLLMAAFRSFWIPIVSAAFNLLSVAAAYGVIVAVFQGGFGANLLGVETGVPIVSFIPVMIFAILFGLSMDYNVFLLSRIHEAYSEGAAPRDSVIIGISRIGKIILFAGLIMASVFLSFVTQNSVPVKMIGIGLGLAILIDVFIIRLVIAPAVVSLLGDKAWWMPKWLDKVLPNISLEGHLVENNDKDIGEE